MAKTILDVTSTIPKDFTVVDLIDGLGGPSAFARICGFTENPHARGCDMRRRQSVNDAYWPNIAGAAQAAGYPHVTVETIHAAHQKPKAKRPKPRRRKKTSLVAA